MSTYRLVCPHCASRMRIRTSEGIHPLMRVAYLQCTQEPCGWTARAEFTITHEMSASGVPNPAVNIPVADTAMRHQAVKKENESQNELF